MVFDRAVNAREPGEAAFVLAKHLAYKAGVNGNAKQHYNTIGQWLAEYWERGLYRAIVIKAFIREVKKLSCIKARAPVCRTILDFKTGWLCNRRAVSDAVQRRADRIKSAEQRSKAKAQVEAEHRRDAEDPGWREREAEERKAFFAPLLEKFAAGQRLLNGEQTPEEQAGRDERMAWNGPETENGSQKGE
jgi:hypothetical protein